MRWCWEVTIVPFPNADNTVVPHGIPEIREMCAACPALPVPDKLNPSDEKGAAADPEKRKSDCKPLRV